MTHAKFHFNWLIFGIWASEPPPPPGAWRTTEKAEPDRVNAYNKRNLWYFDIKPCRFGPVIPKNLIKVLKNGKEGD